MIVFIFSKKRKSFAKKRGDVSSVWETTISFKKRMVQETKVGMYQLFSFKLEIDII